MQDIYEKNLEVMKEDSRYKFLLEFLEENREAEVEAGVEIIEGRKVLYVQKNENIYQLDSMYSGEEWIDTLLKYLDYKWNTTFFLYGFGNGQLVRKLLKGLDKASYIFVMEPSLEVLKTVIREYDLTDILTDGRVVLFLPEYREKDIDIVNIVQFCVSYDMLNDAIQLKHPGYLFLFSEEYKYYSQKLQAMAEAIACNAGTVGEYGKLFVRNSIRNSRLLVDGRSLLDIKSNLTKNSTGILVSAGPSLDKNIDELKNAVGKAMIIACDSSVRALVKHGIRPDMYITVDMEKPLEIFEAEGMEDIPVIASMDGTYEALKKNRAAKFFLASADEYIFKFFDGNDSEMLSIDKGGCEATAAFMLMAELGVKNIILTGQDLAYTGNKGYSQDTVGATWEKERQMSSEFIYVEAIGGGEVPTSRQFDTYRHWFENKVDLIKDNIRVINATEGGARIKGCQEMTLRDAVAEYCNKPCNIEKLIKESNYVLDADTKEKFIEYMHSIPEKLEQVESLIDEEIQVYKELEEESKKAAANTYKIKNLMKKSEELTETIVSELVFYYVETTAMGTIQENERKYAEQAGDRDELQQAVELGLLRYETLKEGLEEFKGILEEIKDDRF